MLYKIVSFSTDEKRYSFQAEMDNFIRVSGKPLSSQEKAAYKQFKIDVGIRHDEAKKGKWTAQDKRLLLILRTQVEAATRSYTLDPDPILKGITLFFQTASWLPSETLLIPVMALLSISEKAAKDNPVPGASVFTFFRTFFSGQIFSTTLSPDGRFPEETLKLFDRADWDSVKDNAAERKSLLKKIGDKVEAGVDQLNQQDFLVRNFPADPIKINYLMLACVGSLSFDRPSDFQKLAILTESPPQFQHQFLERVREFNLRTRDLNLLCDFIKLCLIHDTVTLPTLSSDGDAQVCLQTFQRSLESSILTKGRSTSTARYLLQCRDTLPGFNLRELDAYFKRHESSIAGYTPWPEPSTFTDQKALFAYFDNRLKFDSELKMCAPLDVYVKKCMQYTTDNTHLTSIIKMLRGSMLSPDLFERFLPPQELATDVSGFLAKLEKVIAVGERVFRFRQDLPAFVLSAPDVATLNTYLDTLEKIDPQTRENPIWNYVCNAGYRAEPATISEALSVIGERIKQGKPFEIDTTLFPPASLKDFISEFKLILESSRPLPSHHADYVRRYQATHPPISSVCKMITLLAPHPLATTTDLPAFPPDFSKLPEIVKRSAELQAYGSMRPYFEECEKYVRDPQVLREVTIILRECNKADPVVVRRYVPENNLSLSELRVVATDQHQISSFCATHYNLRAFITGLQQTLPLGRVLEIAAVLDGYHEADSQALKWTLPIALLSKDPLDVSKIKAAADVSTSQVLMAREATRMALEEAASKAAHRAMYPPGGLHYVEYVDHPEYGTCSRLEQNT